LVSSAFDRLSFSCTYSPDPGCGADIIAKSPTSQSVQRRQTSDILSANQGSSDPRNREKNRRILPFPSARRETRILFRHTSCGPLESSDGIRRFTSTQPTRDLDSLHFQSGYLASGRGIIDATEIRLHGGVELKSH